MYAYMYYIAIHSGGPSQPTWGGGACHTPGRVVIFSKTDITILILNQSMNDNNNNK